MIETAKPDQRFQFSLRKLLLWVAVVALCLGIPIACGQNPVVWLLLTCWCAAIGGLRWSFGQVPAAYASIVGAGVLTSVAYAVGDALQPVDYVVAAFAGFLTGIPIGFVLFVMLELAFIFVNWSDSLFNRGERTQVDWLVIGMFCGIVLAIVRHPSVDPLESPRGYHDMAMLQRTASNLYWYSLIGVAIGAACDLLQKPPRVRSFRIGLRELLLAVLSLGSFLLGWFLYVRIVTLSYP